MEQMEKKLTDQELDALVDEATDAFENMESMTDVSIRLIGAVAALRAAITAALTGETP